MEPEPARPLERTGWARLAQSAAQALKVFFGDRFGFDLENWLTTNRLELWGFRERRYAIPVAFLARFASLPVQMLGLLLGEDAAGGFEISHEAAARLGRLFQAGRVTLPEAFIPGWLKGDDLPHYLGALFPAGAVILLTGHGFRPCTGRRGSADPSRPRPTRFAGPAPGCVVWNGHELAFSEVVIRRHYGWRGPFP